MVKLSSGDFLCQGSEYDEESHGGDGTCARYRVLNAEGQSRLLSRRW